MKAVIKTAEFVKEYETKFGTMYQHKITYDDKVASYSSKKKEQTEFIAGKEKEFDETENIAKNGQKYLNVKPITKNDLSGYAKNLKKEQSRYSGFSTSYAKDLVIAGKINFDQLFEVSERLFNHMVALDKTLEK